MRQSYKTCARNAQVLGRTAVWEDAREQPTTGAPMAKKKRKRRARAKSKANHGKRPNC